MTSSIYRITKSQMTGWIVGLKHVKVIFVTQFEVISQQLFVGTDEDHGQRFLGSRFEPRTSWIQSPANRPIATSYKKIKISSTWENLNKMSWGRSFSPFFIWSSHLYLTAFSKAPCLNRQHFIHFGKCEFPAHSEAVESTSGSVLITIFLGHIYYTPAPV